MPIGNIIHSTKYIKWSTCGVKMGFGKYNSIHKISNTSCALQCNEVKFILKFGKLKKLMGLKVHQEGSN